MRVETKQQQGSVNVLVEGKAVKVPVTLTIVETYHDDGRKDCLVKVPKISAGAKRPAGGQ